MPEDVGSRHRLLERQLRKACRGIADGLPDLDLLLDLVSQAYTEQEESKLLNDRAIDLVSQEMTELNVQLRSQAAARTRDAVHLDGILESAHDAIITSAVGENRNILSFNRAAEVMFGLSREEALKRDVSSLFANWTESQKRLKARLDQIGPASFAEEGMEVGGRRDSGETFPMEVSICQTKIDGKTVVTGFYRDISNRKASEAAIVAARDAAESANRAKSEFLAAMSHEIRTPLNGVLGMAAAMQATPLTDEQRGMLGVINDSGQILLTLLSDILDLSKIEAGQMFFEVTPFDLGGSIQAVIQLYAETAAAKGISLRAHVAECARGWFAGDPTRFRQVLQNLISNALKFTDEGGVDVRIDGERSADGGLLLRAEVTDTGIGISEEARARLFTKFGQADSSTTRRYGGTGLGLAISRQIVEDLGGEIGLDSMVGEGSRFWFTLPLGPAEAPETVQSRETCGARAPGRLVRILAAEDNPTNQLVLRAFLGQADIDLVMANNGLEAVDAAREQDFDVILMDVQMPVMDGMAASKAIRAFPGERGRTPIVAVTADAMPDQIKACLAAGMDSHISKPLRPDTLFSAIEDALASDRREFDRAIND